MSHSYQDNCPNCGQQANFTSESRPFEHIFITCFYCGLQVMPQITYMDLEELNFYRVEYDLEPLSELPEQDKQIY